MEQDLARFYGRIKKVVFGTLVISSLLGGILGFVLSRGSSIEAELKQAQAAALQVQGALNKGGDIEALKMLQKAGQAEWADELAASLGKSGGNVDPGGLFGADTFEKLLENMKGKGIVGADAAAEDGDSSLFPEISLSGFMFSGGRASTVLTVSGQSQVWKWERQGGRWVCINPLAGYGVKDTLIKGDFLEFVLFPLTQPNNVRKYTFGDTVSALLSRFRQDSHDLRGKYSVPASGAQQSQAPAQSGTGGVGIQAGGEGGEVK